MPPDTEVAIYEPIYLEGQTLEEPAFRPLLLEGNPFAHSREFGILLHMYRQGLHRRQRLTGILSPKFRMKTKITGGQFLDFIAANPGADVYLANPGSYFAYFTYNVWAQGDMVHAGLLDRAQPLLDAAGIGWNLRDMPRHGPDVLVYCNYWVATERVWNEFVGGILVPIADFLERSPESEAARAVSEIVYHYEPSPYLPFIVERLFTTYLSLSQNDVRPYVIDPVIHSWNDFHRLSIEFLRNRVDRADREGYFPEELKRTMHMIYRLNRQYGLTIMKWHPHPHTGVPLPEDVIERGLRELATVIVKPLE